MDIDALRNAYNRHIRQADSDGNAQREIVGTVYRYRLDAEKFGVVLYTDLTDQQADAVIAEQIAYFRGLGYGLEWKHLSYDMPADLKMRLAQAGLVANEEEAVMVLPIADAPAKLLAPNDMDIRRITTPNALQDVDVVHRAVWGEDEEGMSERILRSWAHDPHSMSVYVAYMDQQPVSYARNDFSGAQGNPFVGLYGGSTLAQYRQRGIYTAMIGARLIEARERGAQFLYVDARQDTSMPILQKLGFVCIGYATGYTMEAGA